MVVHALFTMSMNEAQSGGRALKGGAAACWTGECKAYTGVVVLRGRSLFS